MKEKFKHAFMQTAEIFAELSSAKRLHVGAIIVKDDRIISIGYNGMPSGWDNKCEHKLYMSCDSGGGLDPDEIEHKWPFEDAHGRYQLKSNPEVLHAESNCISKLAKSTESGDGAIMFVTHSPCLDCAKLIYQSGIQSVFYRNLYRSDDGIRFLKLSGVNVSHLDN
jgi:dCMP deaminase